MYGAHGDGRAAMIDVRDVAAVASAIVSGNGHEGGQSYLVTGPTGFSAAQAAAEFEDVLGWPTTAVDLGREGFWNLLQAKGIDPWFCTALCDIERLWRDGYGDVTTNVVEDLPDGRLERFATGFWIVRKRSRPPTISGPRSLRVHSRVRQDPRG